MADVADRRQPQGRNGSPVQEAALRGWVAVFAGERQAKLQASSAYPQARAGGSIPRMCDTRFICHGLALAALCLGVGCGSATPAAQDGPVTAFVGATIVDGTGAPPLQDGVVLVTGDRITAVGPSARVVVPSGATVVDLDGKTLLPGFVNAHGHVTGSERTDLERQLRLYALYGVTTVFSLGGEGAAGLALRDEPAEGRARIFVAGPVVTGTTADAAAGQVAKNADLGVDWIKIRVDDNLGATAKMPREAWTATLREARARDLPVAAHIFYLEDATDLLREGVDLVAHSVRDRPVDAEFIMRAREHDVCVSPTLMREVSTFVYETTPEFFADEFFLRHADRQAVAEWSAPERQAQVQASPSAQLYKEALVQARANLKPLVHGGVRLAMGTDTGPAGRFQGYFEHLELELMVGSGLTPMQAIVAATGDAARCMRQEGVLGTIQPGAFADLVVFGANPVEDIRHTRTLEAVWVGGAPLDF